MEDNEETELERSERRRGIPRPVRRALLSALVLLMVIVGGGVAYIWYTGSNPPMPVKTVAPATVDTTPVIKPGVPGPNVPESAAVETLTSPVNPGANVTMNVKTLPKSQCSIAVMYGTIASKDSGLTPKQADVYGTISWTWTVEANVPAGDYPVHVSCALNGKTAVVDGTLTVTTDPTDS